MGKNFEQREAEMREQADFIGAAMNHQQYQLAAVAILTRRVANRGSYNDFLALNRAVRELSEFVSAQVGEIMSLVENMGINTQFNPVDLLRERDALSSSCEENLKDAMPKCMGGNVGSPVLPQGFEEEVIKRTADKIREDRQEGRTY